MALGIVLASGYVSLLFVTLGVSYEFRNRLARNEFDHLPTRRTRLVYTLTVWVLFAAIFTVIAFSKLRS